jgi:AcrR family transcriptional regulator
LADVKLPSVDRRPYVTGARTRLRILRAAEQVIARRGIEAASLRDITAVAGVNLALVNHHFGSKERLCIEVLLRRNAPINKMRLEQLAEARSLAAPRPIKVEAILDAFLDPLFAKLMSKAPGWRDWGQVVTRTYWSPLVLKHQRESIDEVSGLFIDELRRALPKVRPGSLYFRYVFMVSLVLEVMHGSARVHNLSDGNEDIRDLKVAKAEARTFILGALKYTF